MNQAEFQLRTPSDSTLALAQAILIYKGRSGNVLATVHGIEDVDGEAVIGAGQAVTLTLAESLAEGITQSESIKRDLGQRAELALRKAKRIDGLETGANRRGSAVAKSDWLAARTRGSGYLRGR